MAYKKFYSQEIYNYEQEEIIDKQLIAGEDGVVEEVETLVQEYAHIRVEAAVYQEDIIPSNYSNFRAELIVHVTAGEKGEGFTFKADDGYDGNLTKASFISLGGLVNGNQIQPPSKNTYTVEPGETKSVVIKSIQTDDEYLYSFTLYMGNRLSYDLRDVYKVKSLKIWHRPDGSFDEFQITRRVSSSTISHRYTDLNFVGKLQLQINNLTNEDGTTSKKIVKDFDFGALDSYAIPIDRAIYPTTANNFTDEENASFTYSVNHKADDRIILLQTALSLDGETVDVAYRDIPVDGTNYTFSSF